jgi:hypothetical protein
MYSKKSKGMQLTVYTFRKYLVGKVKDYNVFVWVIMISNFWSSYRKIVMHSNGSCSGKTEISISTLPSSSCSSHALSNAHSFTILSPIVAPTRYAVLCV